MNKRSKKKHFWSLKKQLQGKFAILLLLFMQQKFQISNTFVRALRVLKIACTCQAKMYS